MVLETLQCRAHEHGLKAMIACHYMVNVRVYHAICVKLRSRRIIKMATGLDEFSCINDAMIPNT